MSQYQRVKLLFYVRKIDHAGVLMNEKPKNGMYARAQR